MQDNVPSLMSLFLKQERFEAMVGDLDRMGCVSVAKKILPTAVGRILE